MKKIHLILIIFSFLLQACLEDLNDPEEFTSSNSADLLSYFETSGDFINSFENPAIVTVDELSLNLDKSLLLDVRPPSDYNIGHIENAVNISMNNLIEIVNSYELENYHMIVIISCTGQKAGYVTSLLRLYGITNIYSLDFGMGYWNKDFSFYFDKSRKDSRYFKGFRQGMVGKPRLKNELPSISVDSPENSMDEISKSRISQLLTEDYYSNTISEIEELDERYHLINRSYDNSFIICYGDEALYSEIIYVNRDISPGPLIFGGHPISAVLYNPLEDFKSSNYLLTLPVDQTIYIYSNNGQRSAYIVAYLQMLGYDARSIKFGVMSMLNSYIKINNVDGIFVEKEIRDYPYVN